MVAILIMGSALLFFRADEETSKPLISKLFKLAICAVEFT